ncbi:MAG TPA: hypothetical protein VFT48_12130 [Pyrinomonadaceae bacterium]|nr:hypothetical protein [Pyrinomonadaceae bacterium]
MSKQLEEERTRLPYIRGMDEPIIEEDEVPPDPVDQPRRRRRKPWQKASINATKRC